MITKYLQNLIMNLLYHLVKMYFMFILLYKMMTLLILKCAVQTKLSFIKMTLLTA